MGFQMATYQHAGHGGGGGGDGAARLPEGPRAPLEVTIEGALARALARLRLEVEGCEPARAGLRTPCG